MGAVSTSDARDQFSDLINRVAFGKERQILSRRGTELVAIIPIEDLRTLEHLEDATDLANSRSEMKRASRKGAKAWSKIKAENGL
jgi:prevent-host-death family protein